jgi:hypothetical protein
LKIFYSALLASALIALSAQAQDNSAVVYKGELSGAGTVVMELRASDNDGEYSGRYFYLRHGVDIPVKGIADKLLEAKPLAESDELDKDAGPVFGPSSSVWSGRISGNTYAGEWRDVVNKRTRKFTLQKVVSYQQIDQSFDKPIDLKNYPYDYLKLQSQSKPVGSIVLHGDVAYQMHTDARTKFQYPRLARHPNPAVLKKANALLEQRHWRMSLAALDCASTIYTEQGPWVGSLGEYDNETVNVNFLSTAAITVSEGGSLYCGGAHPYNHYNTYTLDLIRGEELDWDRLLPAFSKSEYGTNEPSEKMRLLIEKLIENPRYRTLEVHEDCSEVLPEYMSLAFEPPNKISIDISDIGHAMSVCLGPQLQVPFSALQSIFKPGAKPYLVPMVPAIKKAQ